MVERGPEKAGVGGSIPSLGTSSKTLKSPPCFFKEGGRAFFANGVLQGIAPTSGPASIEKYCQPERSRLTIGIVLP
jgi:hypothetical protein